MEVFTFRNRIVYVGMLFLFIGLVTVGCSLFPAGIEVSASEPDRTNFIVNGYFEEWTEGGKLAGWITQPVDPGTGDIPEYSIVIEKDVYNGKNAARIVGGTVKGNKLLVQSNIDVKDYENKTLKLTAMYKMSIEKLITDGDTNARSFLRLEFYKDVDGVLTRTHASRTIGLDLESSDWKSFEQEFDVPAETEVVWVTVALYDVDGDVRWTAFDMREKE